MDVKDEYKQQGSIRISEKIRDSFKPLPSSMSGSEDEIYKIECFQRAIEEIDTTDDILTVLSYIYAVSCKKTFISPEIMYESNLHVHLLKLVGRIDQSSYENRLILKILRRQTSFQHLIPQDFFSDEIFSYLLQSMDNIFSTCKVSAINIWANLLPRLVKTNLPESQSIVSAVYNKVSSLILDSDNLKPKVVLSVFNIFSIYLNTVGISPPDTTLIRSIWLVLSNDSIPECQSAALELLSDLIRTTKDQSLIEDYQIGNKLCDMLETAHDSRAACVLDCLSTIAEEFSLPSRCFSPASLEAVFTLLLSYNKSDRKPLYRYIDLMISEDPSKLVEQNIIGELFYIFPGVSQKEKSYISWIVFHTLFSSPIEYMLEILNSKHSKYLWVSIPSYSIRKISIILNSLYELLSEESFVDFLAMSNEAIAALEEITFLPESFVAGRAQEILDVLIHK